MNNQNQFPRIPKEKLAFAQMGERITDQKLDTKPVGYLKDAWLRFRKNKASVTAAVIILLLVAFAVIVPMVSPYTVNFREPYCTKLLPKFPLLSELNIWDGCKKTELNRINYLYYNAMGVETGRQPVKKLYKEYDVTNIGKTSRYYSVRLDSYYKLGTVYLNITKAEFEKIQQYQNETGIQVVYPAVDKSQLFGMKVYTQDANYWYKINQKGLAELDAQGNYQPIYKTTGADRADYDSLRVKGDDGSYAYGEKNQSGYQVRVSYYDYYVYKYGMEPSYIFGSNQYGQDIAVCLASGARFSLMLAVVVSAINLMIGATYGAIEGYYGGLTDLTMERISDILNGVPFMIVATLFQLHLAQKVGAIPSLLFAFISTGWIGIAMTVREQFYRFKGQEYVLAARTLGASDGRLIRKHIFPNALGTIITSSVMIIPGVIFAESFLSYLGIVNLSTSSITSIGTMLADGQTYLQSFPHIIFFPALFISLLEISFNLFGNGLRDAFNPSLRGGDE